MSYKREVDIHDFERRKSYWLYRIGTEIKNKYHREVMGRFYKDWDKGIRGLDFGLPRFTKYLQQMFVILRILELPDFATQEEIRENPLLAKRELGWITEDHTWKIIEYIKERLKRTNKKKTWTVTDYITIFRGFMKWYRKRYGYPEEYPEGKFYKKMLPLLNQAPELKEITYRSPDSTKTADDIPGPWVFDALYIASPPHPRNKAFFSMWRENPNRICGLGSLQCKNFHHHDLGYKITMSDKTFNGEPVRFVESQADISRYIEWLSWREMKTSIKGEHMTVYKKERQVK